MAAIYRRCRHGNLNSQASTQGCNTLQLIICAQPPGLGIFRFINIIIIIIISISETCNVDNCHGCPCVQVHVIYRSSGASFQKAQAEFAQGIVTNRTVQTTAAGVASGAVRGAVDQSLHYESDNRYWGGPYFLSRGRRWEGVNVNLSVTPSHPDRSPGFVWSVQHPWIWVDL